MFNLYLIVKSNMKKINIILTSVISFLCLVALIVVVIIKNTEEKAKRDGAIIVELLDVDNSMIKSKDIIYFEGDTLTLLISDNFENVVFDNGMLTEIEDYKTPADWSTFISVYVNDEMSMVGISDIVIADGMKISLIITEYIYNYE